MARLVTGLVAGSLVKVVGAACDTSSTTQTACDNLGGAYLSTTGKCYLSKGEGTFRTCQSRCENVGGSLADVRSSNTNDYLYTQLISAAGFDASDSDLNPAMYIGFFQDPTEADKSNGWNNWASGCTSGYTNWQWNQPDHFCGYKERCAIIPVFRYEDSGRNDNASWYDAACDGVHYCICETPQGTSTFYDDSISELEDSGEMNSECKTAIAIAVLIFILPGLCCCCCCCLAIGAGIFFMMKGNKKKQQQQQQQQQQQTGQPVAYGQPVQGIPVS